MSVKHFGQRLYYIPKITRWSKGIGAELPAEYKKFWREWKIQEPTAVHYIKQEGTYVRDEETEVVHPVQNRPIPLKYPKEFNQCILGGEALIQGFRKKNQYTRKYPHYWFPQLKKSVVYSEILDAYMSVVVTNRTINLIHEHYGFDHYLLKTPACDLKSELALKLKRQILIALADKTLYPDDPVKREEVYNKYKEYLTAYTREEIEWYGLTYPEACKKWINNKSESTKVEPLKFQYRSELIAKLKEKNEKAENMDVSSEEKHSSWISKLNPFTKTSNTK
ncbi:mitochondrial ribosomal protein L28 [Calliopsis andreniformis]|uniref:mitochondrial ribosomal protein L28 n=1 Tax=Calliopsis andreniformis TaxID=337506 RepID=UPI003FCE4A6A